uniref:uncharacterized protein LOC101304407 isoform X1 n=1 Tax=Fragaria vesca subsp. vesca TaxID=101020 RepID=UPI0005C80835|nr:PREDICTED: uncharacterized protein LOC101304407 isoform X1 [Fragaria vesca subsp. vesca]
MNSQNLGRFVCLEHAEIFLGYEVNYDIENISKFLCSICMAKFVILSELTIKALLSEGSIKAPLSDIRKLGLPLSSLNDELVPTAVSLLKGMPNLNTLYLKCTQFSGLANSVCSGFDMDSWKLQRLSFIYQLKEATLWLPSGSNGIEFARYILENAPNLEKMVIVHFVKQFAAVRELQNKMISNATVVFHDRYSAYLNHLGFPEES